jgi:hypothetical protein
MGCGGPLANVSGAGSTAGACDHQAMGSETVPQEGGQWGRVCLAEMGRSIDIENMTIQSWITSVFLTELGNRIKVYDTGIFFIKISQNFC